MDNFCFTSIFINHNVTAANHLYLLLHRNTNENKNMYYHIVISINMVNNNHLTEIHICVCYYFNGIININDLDLDNTLIDEKSHTKFHKIQSLHVLFLIKY